MQILQGRRARFDLPMSNPSQLCRFYKAEGPDLTCQCPIQAAMQILQGRRARFDLPMSNAARKQLGIQPGVLRNSDKHEVLLTHDLHVGQFHASR